MSKNTPEPDKNKPMLGDLPIEMKPIDARDYYRRGFEVLVNHAEDESRPWDERFEALRAIDWYYKTLVMKDGMDEFIGTHERTHKSSLDEVRRQRRKPWEYTED